MRYLIIGSEGFIGKNLVSQLLKNGDEVFGVDILDVFSPGYHYTNCNGDISNIEAILKDRSIDSCINAAGNGNLSYALEFPFEDYLMNCKDCFRLLDCIRRFQPSIHYIHLSSAAVYGNPDSLPIKEDAPKKPISPYGWHKLMAEQVCEEFVQLYNMSISILRPFSVYGPGLKKQIIWDLYNKCNTSVDSIELWGTGNETRDFIFITDLVHAIDIISKNKLNGLSVYNLASGHEKKVSDVAEIFVKKFKPAIEIVFNNAQRQGDPLYWKADITKVRDLGFTPATSFEEGITAYIDWIKQMNQ